MERKKTTLIIFAFLFSFLLLAKAYAGNSLSVGERTDLEKLVAYALKNHPAIQAAINNLEVTKSRVGQAKSSYYPQIKWNNEISRIAPARSPTYSEYASSLSLTQNIYDFNRRETQVNVQNLYETAAQADLDDTTIKIVFGVKQAYYELLRAIKNRLIAYETVKQFEKHLHTAKGLFETGVRPKFDVTKAEADLSNAQLNLIKAENAVILARVSLNNAIGLPNAPPFEIEDDTVPEVNTNTLEEALKQAFQKRPDLKSLMTKKEAALKVLELAKKDYYPLVTGVAGYGFSGDEFPLQRGWNVGANLSIELFSGYATKYKINEAQANVEVLKANEAALRQTIRLEVEQSFANLKETEKRIEAAKVNLRQAEENLELAEGRYAAGVGNPLEVTDALVTLGNAKTALANALYDYKIASANLKKAMGDK